MKWTEKQRETIEARDRNILVAAAAGSGKTAVLVERIRRMAMEEKIPLDSMLIVTFTKAAAAEMKDKIRRALKEKLEEDPSVRDQLERINRAQISTFHSFSLDVVRHFFFLTELEPDISICDEARGKLLKEEALDDLFREAFQRDDEEFYTLLDWYGSEKNDGNVREILKSLYDTIMALPDPFGTLGEKIRELSNYRESAAWQYRQRLITGKLRQAEEASLRTLNCLRDEGLDRLAAKYEDEWKAYQRLSALAEAGDYQGAAGMLDDFPKLIMRAKNDEKDTYDMVKPAMSAARDKAKKLRIDVASGFLEDETRQLAEVEALAPVAGTLKRLLEEFHDRFRKKKQERKQVDFNDIEHYCLEILKDPDARKYYREKFRYIFVDEYQDTSVMQEAIIESIAGENNLFMVGDIKQSIYKFRLAEPEIFQDRYQRYGSSDNSGEVGTAAEIEGAAAEIEGAAAEIEGTAAEIEGAATEIGGAAGATSSTATRNLRIDLNRNFRSKPLILDWINQRFEPLMEGYDEAARLYPGIDCPEEYAFRPEIRLLDTSLQEESDDETIREMQNDELEAHLVCDIIQENLGKPFFDSKAPDGGMVRPMEYRDMAVLVRSIVTTGPVWQDVMQQRGIPVFVDNTKGYYDTIEINVMMNLLSVIDNRYRDVPFLSVLRSEIFGFSTEELAEVRLLIPQGSYVEAFCQVAEGDSTRGNKALCLRAKEVLEQLDRWRGLANTMPLPDYVWMLLRESGYYLLAGAMPRGDLRQANLRRLVDLTAEFARSGQASLYGFVKYIESIKKDKNVDIGQVRMLSENDDVVRMMTIHKSKGLEFPMVVVANTGRQLHYTDSKQRIRFHKDLGLGMFLEDPENRMEKKTLAYRLVMEKLREEEREENKRVLYVAMTRARDRLYLTGTVKGAEALLDAKEAGDLSDTTFLGMMPSLDDVRITQPEELGAAGGEAAAGEERVLRDPGPLEEEIRRRLSYRYPFPGAEKIRSKYSVSALNAEAHRPAVSMEEPEEEGPDVLAEVGLSEMADVPAADSQPAAEALSEAAEALPVPRFLEPEQKLTGAERGTIYHRIMEYIDFPGVATGGRPALEEAMERMVSEEILLPMEARAVDPAKILRFFETPLGRRCEAAARRGALYREQSFVLAMEREGEQTGVQGIIDAFFQEEGRIILLDYKTNAVNPKKPFAEEAERIAAMYRQQQALYASALEKSLGVPVGERWLYLFSAGQEILL